MAERPDQACRAHCYDVRIWKGVCTVLYTVFVTRTHIKANIDTALGRTGVQTRSRRDIRAVRLLLHSTAVCAFFGLWTSSFTDNNL